MHNLSHYERWYNPHFVFCMDLEIATELGMKLGNINVSRFADGECNIQVRGTMRKENEGGWWAIECKDF